MYQAPPALPHPDGVARAHLGPLGARYGAGIGVLSAMLYGLSIIAIVNSGRDVAALLLWVILAILPVALIGGLPALVVGWLLGHVIGVLLRRLPARAPGWHAAAVGTILTGSGALLLHGLWLLAGGEISWADSIQYNPYRLLLGQPSGLAVVISAIMAPHLYRRVQDGCHPASSLQVERLHTTGTSEHPEPPETGATPPTRSQKRTLVRQICDTSLPTPSVILTPP